MPVEGSRLIGDSTTAGHPRAELIFERIGDNPNGPIKSDVVKLLSVENGEVEPLGTWTYPRHGLGGLMVGPDETVCVVNIRDRDLYLIEGFRLGTPMLKHLGQ